MRARPVEAWRRVPPALATFTRTYWNEAGCHAKTPVGGVYGELIWVDDQRRAYLMARRARTRWRMAIWNRRWPRPTARAGARGATAPA